MQCIWCEKLNNSTPNTSFLVILNCTVWEVK